MKKVKIFAFMLSLSMLLGSVASAASFSDMPSDPKAQTAVENAVKNGIISGYDDGTFRPDAYITRAEMASIITRACGAQEEGNLSTFSDVPYDKWYYSSVSKAYKMGALSGSYGKMNPENYITFQECFTILSKVFDLVPSYTLSNYPEVLPEYTVMDGKRLYDVSVLKQYNDGNQVADWAKVYYAGVVEHGGWTGVNQMLTPTANITRLQFATVMDNLFKNYIDMPGKYTSLPAGNTLIRCNDVVLDGVTTEDDIYIADGVSAQHIIIQNANVKGRLVVRGCATPVIDENGGTVYGDVGIIISGHFDKVRVIRPYINLDMTGATYGSLYSTSKTNVSIFANFN